LSSPPWRAFWWRVFFACITIYFSSFKARHEVLRRISLKTKPTNALRRYLKKVIAGTEPNPWVPTVYSEKDLRKKLRRFVVAMMIKACKNQGVEDCGVVWLSSKPCEVSLPIVNLGFFAELDKSHEAAIRFIDRLNEEIVESLSILGNFSSDLIRCARTNCQKAFVPNHVAHTLVSRVKGDYTHCQGSSVVVPDCPHVLGTHDDVNYLIVEGGSYSQDLEMPSEVQSTSKVLNVPNALLCLCYFHNGIFEFMFDVIHMKWNIFHNCLIHVKEVLKNKKFKDSDEVIEELPSDVIRSLVHFYMARYFCLWVFGDKELWSKNGCTLFQVLFRMDAQIA
ncbi:hypothetical protein COOONC_28536, partial [Cooperia oncophora]